MANIIFASNNIAHFIGSTAGSVVGAYNTSRVPYSIQFHYEELAGSPIFLPSTNGVTWFHFMTFSEGVTNSFDEQFLISAVDTDDNLLFWVEKDGSNTGKRYLSVKCYDGATVKDTQTALMVPNDRLVSIDIRYEVTGSLISLEFYINGSKLVQHTFNANPNSYSDPVQFTLGGGLAGASNPGHFSEIILSDESTLNARLDFLRPASAGAYEEWDGSLTTLADSDRTTGMTTLAAAKRQSVIMSAYSGAPNVSNLVAVSTTTRGINSPTQMKHSVRLSGVDYDSAAYAVDFAAKYILTDFTLNPATSLAWTEADLAAVEMGFLSVA